MCVTVSELRTFKICLLWILFCRLLRDSYVENTTPISESWHFSLEFHGFVTLLNTAFHFTEKVTDWLYLWPCLYTRSLCTIRSATCKTYTQIFKNAGIHLKSKRSSYPIPAQIQCSNQSHLPEDREVGCHLCFLLSNSCCLLPNEAPAIYEHWTAQVEFEVCCRTDSCT